MTDIPTYIQGAELPDYTLAWYGQDGELIDFSSGWTFTLLVGTPGQPALLTKSSGIAGDDADPNVTIAWASSGELNDLAPGLYTCDLRARRGSDSKDRFARFALRVDAPIAAGS